VERVNYRDERSVCGRLTPVIGSPGFGPAVVLPGVHRPV